MVEKINIQNMDGSMEQVDLVNSFKIDAKNFVIMSKGEIVNEGAHKIYISEVIETSPGVYKLMGIQNQEIWENVKKAIKEIVNK